MPRKRKAIERTVLPDPKYNDVILSKFINGVMEDGKKSVAERIVYGAFEIIEAKLKKDPLEVFREALVNARPLVKVTSRRVGGANYQVPEEVNEKAGRAIAFRWIISVSRGRNEKNMRDKLAAELMAIYKKEGSTIKKREDTHKMADANKAFAHLRF